MARQYAGPFYESAPYEIGLIKRDGRDPWSSLSAFMLHLSADDVDKITAFFDGLTGEQPKLLTPILPPSGAGTPRPEP